VGGASSAGPLAMNVQRDVQQALHLYRQLNMQMSLPTGGYLSSQPCKEEATNNIIVVTQFTWLVTPLKILLPDLGGNW
jgi:hypothetical protein